MCWTGKGNLQLPAIDFVTLSGSIRTDHLNAEILYLPVNRARRNVVLSSKADKLRKR